VQSAPSVSSTIQDKTKGVLSKKHPKRLPTFRIANPKQFGSGLQIPNSSRTAVLGKKCPKRQPATLNL
jgi:hypothetical protein